MPEWRGSFDFFISHRSGDGARHAAEVRQVLEDAGFRVASQHPDIATGDNFLARIHEFLEQARDLIVILTRDYDQSRYTLLELTSFLAIAMQVGESRRLLVVRVDDCRPPGLLAPFSYVDLVAGGRARATHASSLARPTSRTTRASRASTSRARAGPLTRRCVTASSASRPRRRRWRCSSAMPRARGWSASTRTPLASPPTSARASASSSRSYSRP
ncbi:MAG: toll/interleukin-1 receptor domain-containing protein [Deltaproteobacteria bacterium]|nr:MAG: toll/interleukin-1 receptor domain-containing protein [Deltaproteobacteria bacterium]TMQ16894.1 MAG: toll/interleukin-1 receptor domain-containing protein [Deltaproteobacteria bacterium]